MIELIKKEFRKAVGESGRGWRAYFRLIGRLVSLVGYFVQGRWYLRGANRRGTMVFARGRLSVRNRGVLTIGNKVRFWSGIQRTHLIVEKNARLSIGDNCYINGAVIAASLDIRIGNNCYLAPMAQIQDSEYFGLGLAAPDPSSRPVVVEDDAWLATRCIVMPGVRIGRGAVVAVGALVTEDVEDFCVVAGVPAKVVRNLLHQPLTNST